LAASSSPIPLSGGRSVVISKPTGKWPDCVRIKIEGGGGLTTEIGAWRHTSPNCRKQLETQHQLNDADTTAISAAIVALIADDQAAAAAAAAPVTVAPTIIYVHQRQRTAPAATADTYPLDSGERVFTYFSGRCSAADAVASWDCPKLLAALDIDFHGGAGAPPLHQVEVLARELQPQPLLWCTTIHGGLRAIYYREPNFIYDAVELAVCAGLRAADHAVVTSFQGKMEVLTETRHPRSTHDGKSYGPVHREVPNQRLSYLGRFTEAGCLENEVDEIREELGLDNGRYDHSHCPIEPAHVSQSQNPVEVRDAGIYCHSCAARHGSGFRSWAAIRKARGLPTAAPSSVIGDAAKNLIHYHHAAYLMGALTPEIQTHPQPTKDFRRHVYAALAKYWHIEKAQAAADPRLDAMFNGFGYARGCDGWLHADTLLGNGRALDANDVGVLPSTQYVGLDEDGVAVAKRSQTAVTQHRDNGNIPGWTPIEPHLFTPVYFQHNRFRDSRIVRVYPRVKTTKESAVYVDVAHRMNLDIAWKHVTDYFPGIDVNYVTALIMARGCAESRMGKPAIIEVTGDTGSAKTTTVRIVQEMYGEPTSEITGARPDRLDQLFGESLSLSRLILFDDFAKGDSRSKDVQERHQMLYHLLLRIGDGVFSFHKLHKGLKQVPMESCVVLTDMKLPPFFVNDAQFGRRVVLVRLDRPVPNWEAMGRQLQGWWRTSPELVEAVNAIHSYICDTYFAEGQSLGFQRMAKMIGYNTVKEDLADDDATHAIRDLVCDLVRAIGGASDEPEEVQHRVGRGMKLLSVGSDGSAITVAAKELVASLGDRKLTGDLLKHVIDPFQAQLHLIFGMHTPAMFQVKEWGERTYIRLIESGKSKYSKSRLVNTELFTQWPPAMVASQEVA
jgi:hypothetical protein